MIGASGSSRPKKDGRFVRAYRLFVALSATVLVPPSAASQPNQIEADDESPAERVLVSFAPRNVQYKIGDEVLVEFRMVNGGSSTIAFRVGGQYRGANRNNRYRFSADFLGSEVPDIGTSLHFGGIGVVQTLNPGDAFSDVVNLKDWFALNEAGTYRIHGSYHLELVDPDSASFQDISEEYVASDFSIEISN